MPEHGGETSLKDKGKKPVNKEFYLEQKYVLKHRLILWNTKAERIH